MNHGSVAPAGTHVLASSDPRRIQGLNAAGSIRLRPARAWMRWGLAPAGAETVAQIARRQCNSRPNTVIRTQPTWTTERTALLRNLMNAGFSCGQIAREIGVSRNAVIGKVNRLGLSRSKRAADRPRGQRGTRKNRNVVTRYPMLQALWTNPQLAPEEAPDDSISRCSLLELQEWHCRWPCGDPSSADFGFCGNRPVDGLPYCSAHARMAYRRRLSRSMTDRTPPRDLHSLAAP